MRIHRILYQLTLTVFVFLLTFSAHADFQVGKEAFERGDNATALKEWLPLAQQGNPEAQTNLGFMYHEGLSVPRDYKEATRWYQLAVAQGNATAQTNLAVMYANGRGVSQDYQEAARLFRMAAEQGYPLPQFQLSSMYANGQGVSQNYQEAARWKRLAAEQGQLDAQTSLGAMYFLGQGVTKDYVQAHKWFTLAAAAGDKGARKVRNIVEQRMTLAQIDEAQRLAREWQPTVKSDTHSKFRLLVPQ